MKWFSGIFTMKFIIFISLLALGYCRPQDSNQKPTVEIEKQTIVELPTNNAQSRQLTSEEEKMREASTKDILQKIAEVNLNHGLKPKIVRRNPFYSAYTPLLHHQQKQKQETETKGKQLPNFQFSNTPFANPIFDYLQRNQNNPLTKQASYSSDNNEDEEIPEGYAIKRKITHQQTLFIPNYPQMPEPYYNQMFASLPIQSQLSITKNGQYGLIPINQNLNVPDTKTEISKNNTNQNSSLDELTLAKQNFLINNIKNIISNSQGTPGMYSNQYSTYPIQVNPYLNPYQSYSSFPSDPYNTLRVSNPYINPYNSYVSPQNYFPAIPTIPLQNQKFTDTYYANLQTDKNTESRKFLGPNQNLPNSDASGRQFNGPFSEYFPIVIKNPFQQMFQAITSMVEYGPQANLCRRNEAEDKKITGDEDSVVINKRGAKSLNRETKSSSANKPSFELKDKNTNTEIVIQNIEETPSPNNDNDFYIEDLKIVGDNKPEINKSEVEVRQTEEEEGVFLEEDKFFNQQRLPPKEDIPGNGIFIQKLKVRKGGVAIAGPGGIATAGSGGTAIVGPNGFAYTQPNGVAIAGPGSRVISVDPSVNLSEFVQNVMKNGTMSRLGRVVAVGPVVYHDIGQK